MTHNPATSPSYMQSLGRNNHAPKSPRQGTNFEDSSPSHTDADMIETGKKGELTFDKRCLASALHMQYSTPQQLCRVGNLIPVLQIRNTEVKNLRQCN